jgi:phosphoribosylformimino-5-aminoimidazole carboxamide ribotide isomerase
MEIIPAIDLIDGRVVRLLQGDYALKTTYEGSAIGVAMRYAEAGANWLHVVDLDGARSGRFENLNTISILARDAGLKIQAGGGVRTAQDVDRLLIAGVHRVVVGSLAVREPTIVINWIERFGADRITVAFDVQADADGALMLKTAGWREQAQLSLWDGLALYAQSKLKHLLCTDIARDGMLSGPNVPLYRALSESHPELAVQASGGVGGLDDVRALRGSGVAGAIIGKALLEGRLSLKELL